MATARAAVALAVHKPRGYVSERVPGDVDALGRPSIYSLLPDPSVSGSSRLSAVGRLDLETSGLMLFTDSPTLNAAVRGSRLPKTYVATVSGAGVDEDTSRAAITSMREPLRRRDDTPAPTVPPASASDDDEDPWTTPRERACFADGACDARPTRTRTRWRRMKLARPAMRHRFATIPPRLAAMASATTAIRLRDGRNEAKPARTAAARSWMSKSSSAKVDFIRYGAS